VPGAGIPQLAEGGVIADGEVTPLTVSGKKKTITLRDGEGNVSRVATVTVAKNGNKVITLRDPSGRVTRTAMVVEEESA
jgi:hypothetical protein